MPTTSHFLPHISRLRFRRVVLFGILVPGVSMALAATPDAILNAYVSKAAQPGFTASATRGQTFFNNTFSASTALPSCAICHMTDPTKEGRHAMTGKRIAPMAPAVNAERFTDSEKTEKWFKRNCGDVLGRACTAEEKADFVAYLIGVKK